MSLPTSGAVATSDETLAVDEYEEYEDYVDAHITEQDMAFLGDQDVARQLIEWRVRCKDVHSREEFQKKKIEAAEKRAGKGTKSTALSHDQCDLAGAPLLQALADREELVRSSKLSVRPSVCVSAGGRGRP